MKLFFAIGIAVSIWWLLTAIGLRVNRGSTQTMRYAMVLISMVALIAVVGVAVFAQQQGVVASYGGFICAMLIWAWHELSYYSGSVTGPRPEACPAGVSTWQRFCRGVGASLYHELAIVGTAILLAVLSIPGDNRAAFWTFLVLWLMRWSAKLNIFFGVSNLHPEFWPERLRYLTTFAGQARVSPWFVLSLLLAALGLWYCVRLAFAAPLGEPTGTTAILLSVLIALGIAEHLALVLPLPDERFWNWSSGLRVRGP